VLISFFNPKFVKLCAKYLVKLLHSGSSQGNKMVFPLKTFGSNSKYALISFSISEYCV